MIDCEICKQRIQVDEPMIIFSPKRLDDHQYMHNCCLQEHFLFEVWNALSLGIKYESHCKHVDYASGFNPTTFTPEDIIRGLNKQISKQPKGGKWWKR